MPGFVVSTLVLSTAVREREPVCMLASGVGVMCPKVFAVPHQQVCCYIEQHRCWQHLPRGTTLAVFTPVTYRLRYSLVLSCNSVLGSSPADSSVCCFLCWAQAHACSPAHSATFPLPFAMHGCAAHAFKPHHPPAPLKRGRPSCWWPVSCCVQVVGTAASLGKVRGEDVGVLSSQSA